MFRNVLVGLALALSACKIGFDPPASRDDGGLPADASRIDADPLADDAAVCAEAWWDTQWSARRQLHFQNAGAGALVDVPVLVSLDASLIAAFANPAAADELRFIDGDGTELSYEVDSFSSLEGARLWVKVPQIDDDSNADFIEMYYGNAAAPAGSNAAEVWATNYDAVWHLQESSGDVKDSAASITCSFTSGGAGTQDVAGYIAGGMSLDGTTNSADCGSDRIAETVGHTITAWVNMPLTGNTNQEVVAIENLGAPFRGKALYIERASGAVGKWLGNSYHYGTDATSKISADEWTFVALRGVNDASTGVIEVSTNGGPWETIVSGDTSNLTIEANTPLVLGAWTGGGPSAKARGSFDEIRISSVARSDDWIAAQYRSMVGSLLSIGNEQTPCSP